MRNNAFPLTIKHAGVTAKIRHTSKIKNEREYHSYIVEYILLGRRKQEWFSDLCAAKKAASDACIKISNGEQGVLQLNSQDRMIYLRAMDLLRPTGMALDCAVAQFAQSVAALNGKSDLLDAVKDFVARNSVAMPKINVADAVDCLHKQTETDGKSKKRRLHLVCVLGRFADCFNVEVHTLTPSLISQYLAALPFRERTKRNHRDAIGFFNRWLVMRGYLAKGTNWLEGVQNYSARKIGEITTYSPDEMRMFLAHANERLLPVLVIGGFAGLRHAEIARLDWSDIDLEEGFIEIAAHKSKTDTRRIVPIKENLKAWLSTMAKPRGPVIELANTSNALWKLANKAGIKWKHNALRHTYISARVAECADVPRVADEAGNSPQIIRTNYLKRIRPALAAAWFSILPSTPGNVMPVTTEQKAA